MSRQVQIAPGYKDIVLPDNRRYQGGQIAVLTDDEFAAISSSALGKVILDQGVPVASQTVPPPPSPTSDGFMQWDAGQGKYVDVPPFGDLASSTNESQVPTLISSSGPKIEYPGNTVTVGPSKRPVWIEVYAACQQMVVGGGLGMLSLYDTTYGQTVTFLVNFFTPFPCPTTLGATSKFFNIGGALRVGQLTTQRTYKVVAQEILDTSSAAQFELLHGNSNSPGSYIRAVAR